MRSRRGLARVGELGDRADVAEGLAERVRVQGDDARTAGDRLGDRAHVVDAHGAHRAQRLGHDEVGLELVQALRHRARRSPRRARCARARRRRSRRAEPGGQTSRVICGSERAAAGKSHSCVTATTSSPSPRAKSNSVAWGTRLTIRIGRQAWHPSDRWQERRAPRPRPLARSAASLHGRFGSCQTILLEVAAHTPPRDDGAAAVLHGAADRAERVLRDGRVLARALASRPPGGARRRAPAAPIWRCNRSTRSATTSRPSRSGSR